jgi:hypothetical protein
MAPLDDVARGRMYRVLIEYDLPFAILTAHTTAIAQSPAAIRQADVRLFVLCAQRCPVIVIARHRHRQSSPSLVIARIATASG